MSTFNEKLIELVRSNTFLYDKKSPTYKNVVKKTRTWEQMGETLNVSGEECSKRWKSLRDRYVRELRKKEGLSGGTGTESQQYESQTWELMDSMDFLKDVNQPRKTMGNFTEESASSSSTQERETFEETPVREDVDDASNDNTLQYTPKTQKQKRKNINDINTTFLEATATFKETMASKKSRVSEDEKFGETVGLMISNIEDPIKKRKIKAYILQYLANLNAEQFDD